MRPWSFDMRAALVLMCVMLGGCGSPPVAKAAPLPPLVDTVPAGQEAVERVVRLLGQAEAVDGLMLTSKTSGLVAAIEFANGVEVAAGQVLLRLDSARETASLREAQGERDKATKELDNRKPLLDKGLVSQDEIDRLAAELAAKQGAFELAQANLADRTMVAPFAGTIGIRRVGVGSQVAPGTPIAPLVRLDPMQVAFGVPEVHIALLKSGLAVRATSPAWPGRVFNGSVVAIDPGADVRSRAVATVAVLPNPDRALRPGMALTVELVVERRERAVTVPEAALVMQGSKPFVWCIVEGKAVRTMVVPGVRMSGSVEIASGLEAGAQVVVQGLQAVRDGVVVQVRAPAKPDPSKKP